MLRLPPFQLEEPKSLYAALVLLAEAKGQAMVIAGGTALLPNLKHRLFEPKLLVSLARIEGFVGIELQEDGALLIGPMTPLAQVAASELVQDRAPALAQAASLVAGPQLRTQGTLGGNVMLDTRCQWYNQTHFWRQSLGYCLKKDGTECHVVKGGQKCVAAASNDTAPALMTLQASLCFERLNEKRDLPIRDLWSPDGIWNKRCDQDELLTSIRVPAQEEGHRGAYGKLRTRESIDFPLLGIAARLTLSEDDTISSAELCGVALAARPSLVRGVSEALTGTRPGTDEFNSGLESAAQLAYKQLRPVDNVPGSAWYRREMVPVLAKRTLQAAARGEGPVHPL